MTPSTPQGPKGPSDRQPMSDASDRRPTEDPALDELRGLWGAVQAPALPPEELAEADPATRATVDWVRTALIASTPPCPAPADRRLPPPSEPLAWRRPTLAAAALLLALAVGLQRAPQQAAEEPLDLIANAGPQATKSTPDGHQAITNGQSEATSSPDAGLELPRGLSARPNDAGLELRAGPVRLTYVTSPKTL